MNTDIDYSSLPLPSSVSQLTHNVEQCFACVRGEPRAYTRDPPLLLSEDMVTTGWIEEQVKLYNEARKAKDEMLVDYLRKLLLANGVHIENSKEGAYWKRDEDKPLIVDGAPNFWYFTLAYWGMIREEAPYVRALWAQFGVLLEHAKGLGRPPGRPRLLWRRAIRFDSVVPEAEAEKPEPVMGSYISARIAVPVLHETEGVLMGVLRPIYRKDLIAFKEEGALAAELTR